MPRPRSAFPLFILIQFGSDIVSNSTAVCIFADACVLLLQRSFINGKKQYAITGN
jgi:hypothetical protein